MEIAPGVDDGVLRVGHEPDPVKAPAHYAGDGEVSCMRAMRSMHAGWARARGGYPMTAEYERQLLGASYWVTTAFKYVWRWAGKNGAEDLRKARQCLAYALEEMGEADGE